MITKTLNDKLFFEFNIEDPIYPWKAYKNYFMYVWIMKPVYNETTHRWDLVTGNAVVSLYITITPDDLAKGYKQVLVGDFLKNYIWDSYLSTDGQVPLCLHFRGGLQKEGATTTLRASADIVLNMVYPYYNEEDKYRPEIHLDNRLYGSGSDNLINKNLPLISGNNWNEDSGIIKQEGLIPRLPLINSTNMVYPLVSNWNKFENGTAEIDFKWGIKSNPIEFETIYPTFVKSFTLSELFSGAFVNTSVNSTITDFTNYIPQTDDVYYFPFNGSSIYLNDSWSISVEYEDGTSYPETICSGSRRLIEGGTVVENVVNLRVANDIERYESKIVSIVLKYKINSSTENYIIYNLDAGDIKHLRDLMVNKTISDIHQDLSFNIKNTFSIKEESAIVVSDFIIANVDICPSRYYVLWQERYGGFQCQPFEKVETFTESFKRSSLANYLGEKRMYQNEVTPKWKLNTGWVKEKDLKFWESLYVSNNITLWDTKLDKAFSVYLSTNNFTEKTFRSNGGRMFNIQIELELNKAQNILY